MKDFSFWEKYDGASEGSGRSEKIWLLNPDTDQIGLFKFKKDIYWSSESRGIKIFEFRYL